VSDVDRVERFRLTLRFFDDVSTASWFTFSILTSNFSTTRRNFQSVLSMLFLFSLKKVHVNFYSVFYRDYRAVVTSSRHRPFCFHNFVFLLNCLFVLYNAQRISVCVIAVSKSHKFLLNFVDFLFFDDDAYAFTSTRHNFFHDDARDSTSTTSRRFFPLRRTLDCEALKNWQGQIGTSRSSIWHENAAIFNSDM